MADPKDDDEDIAEEMALGAAGANAEAAGEFLRAKTELLRVQARQTRVGHFREWLYASAEIVLGIVILLIFVGIASAIWSAAHDNGLVIESFSVPPDLAQRGLTGQVVAAKLLDKLSALQAQTASNRASSSYANNWGDDIKVQIPDTGVSVGELNAYLRDWLGHETRISGEVYRTADGIAVTARVGNGTGVTFTGKDADFDKLIQQAAEQVYGSTQAYRYAVYLMSANRLKEAQAVFEKLLENGAPNDRAWAAIGLGNLAQLRGDPAADLAYLRRAVAQNPNFVMAYINIAGVESQIQHDEAELAAQKKVVSLLARDTDPDLNPKTMHLSYLAAQAAVAADTGDYNRQTVIDEQILQQPEFVGIVENARQQIVQALAFRHDIAGMRQAFAQLPPTKDPQAALNRMATRDISGIVNGDGRNLLKDEGNFETALRKLGVASTPVLQRQLWPFVAYAKALSGDFSGAHATIDRTPADCLSCLRYRGAIDAFERNWSGAGFWFAKAVKFAPSLPLPDAEWGRMLLDRGDYDGAIAKFEAANQKGPHFADPLEMWGEALMAKNRSDLALAKFAEAAKYAPNWGRLHLKWGEALYWTGDKAGAQKQFAIASHLDLTPPEKSELEKVLHGG